MLFIQKLSDLLALFTIRGLFKIAVNFGGWLVCPVCKRETRHCTKDTHDSPVSKMRRIWCEDCRVVQMQFNQTNSKWE